MSFDRLNKIIFIFLQRNTCELTDSDLSNACRSGGKDKPYSTEEIRHVVQLLGSSLFQLQLNKDGTFFIRIEPTIAICEDFINGTCKFFKTGGCSALHLCRYFGRCTKKGCHFPHDLKNGNNRRIIEQANCQNMDPLLLVRLIQLKQFSRPSFRNSGSSSVAQKVINTMPPPIQTKHVSRVFERSDSACSSEASRSNISSAAVRGDSVIQSVPLSSPLDTKHQLDVSFPSTSINRHITLDSIEAFLNQQGLSVQNRFNLQENENFYRWTVQFDKDDAIDNLLQRPVISYEGVDLKFKLTKRMIDPKSFILKTTIDLKKDPITIESFSNYVDILINHGSYKLIDLSLPLEQVILVQCDKIIDFSALHRLQKSRRQVQGRSISLKHVYEIDTVVIESIDTSLSTEIIQSIIEPVCHDVFTFLLKSNQTALVEFIHSDVLKQWLSTTDITKQKFGIDIKPKVKFADENDNVVTSHTTKATQSTKPKPNTKSSPATIYVSPGWGLVARHPTFSIEYKSYIRAELGYEIDIRGNRIQILTDLASDSLPKEHHSSLLNNRTGNFMHRFAIRSVPVQQQREQLDILRAHAAIVAFCRVKDNNYMIAGKKSDIDHIMQKLLPSKPVDAQPSTTSTAQATIKPADTKQSSKFVIPSPLMNSMSTNETPTSDFEIITKSVTLSINTPAQMALFADTTFENHLRTYFNKTYDVKMSIELMTGNSRRRLVKIIGQQSTVDKTMEELLTLLSLFRTKTFDKTTDNDWIKISDAARVIQHQLTRSNYRCVCQQQTSPISILVHYVDQEHTALGISEQVIDTLCRKKLTLATCNYMFSTRSEKEWMTLITTILRRADYGKNICLFDEYPHISLFGLPQVVKDLQQQFQSTDTQFETAVTITKSQVNCSPLYVENEPKKSTVAKQHDLIIPNPSKINDLTTHREYTQINIDRLPETPGTHKITFSIDVPGFEVLITQDSSRLSAIVGSKCLLQKQIINQQIQIQIPKAKITELPDDTSDVQFQQNNLEPPSDSNVASTNTTTHWFFGLFQRKKTDTPLSQSVQQKCPPSQVQSSSSSNNRASISVGQSKIIVCTGDLTKQAVDIIVMCSTSKILCDKIISAAGLQVKTVYDQQSSYGTLTFETGGGNLPCKQIIFRPWTSDKSQLQDLKQSIGIFVTSAITYALRCNCTTLAFPSIGCGQLGHDPKLIAEHMIGETYQQLKISHQSQLTVSFVLLPEQQNVFDAFTDRLNTIKFVNDVPASVSFDKQIVKITLIGSNHSELLECQNKIKELARSCSLKLHLTDKTDMADWSQSIIEKYYDYCLQKRVVPTLDIQNSILDLEGPKDAVLETEKYFYQLTAETLRQARIQYVPRGFIWLFEVSPGKWDQYSSRINDQIEDAQFKKLPHIEFTNEKSERCRVSFSRMVEEYQKRKRAVCRKRIDSSLPTNWDSFSGNFKRVILQNTSKEYKDIFDQFNTTMRLQYSKIVKIERIQNERWYKQYDAHRDDFQQRYKHSTEKLLFHGCANTSADKIAQECFNRGFAGANGVLYGCGVYFHAHANYSHSYTRPNALGERTMFLARVLIGKSCVGASVMKVPPQGFDTTTDGEHIFVIYHDAGAYGEHLITYH